MRNFAYFFKRISVLLDGRQLWKILFVAVAEREPVFTKGLEKHWEKEIPLFSRV